MISSLKITLNCSWKFSEELECAFGVVGKILMSRISWNLFGKIWIQKVGDIDFEVISAAENSNKFQKIRFWKEKSVEDVVTLGPLHRPHL
jgi:hypothetical protein